MRLRVIGSSSSVPRPGRACSCHLLRSAHGAVVFDFGNGAFSKLRETMDYTSVNAVIVSHMHPDHFLDLIPLRYALRYGPLLRPGRLALWLPPGGEAMLRSLCAHFSSGSGSDFLDEVFEVCEYDPAAVLPIADLELRFAKTRHYIDGYAVRAGCGTTAVVYSSDTAPCEAVEALAHGCSLLLAEATLGLGTEEGQRGHLSAAEAGDLARAAGARRLLLTHYGTDYAAGELEDAAEIAFGSPCAVADDGTELSIL